MRRLVFLACIPLLGSDTTVVGVKLLKQNIGEQAAFTVHVPQGCSLCDVLEGPEYQGQNAREIFFHLRVPVDGPVLKGVRVDTGGIAVRSVVVEKAHIPYAMSGREATFDVPIQPRERSSTVELQTSLESPGMVVRVEHAFEDRRAGKYATGQWPAVERQAALNLEFALREAIGSLGIDLYVRKNGLGKLHIMGFDTNNPLGHEDYPPHIHLILRWPHYTGSQAPHFYLNSEGLITGVAVTIDGMPQVASARFERTQRITTVDYKRNRVYDTMVTSEGGLEITKLGGESCRIAAAGSGFQRGASVDCGGKPRLRVSASDDVKAGEVRVSVSGREAEIYRYDPDTAALIR